MRVKLTKSVIVNTVSNTEPQKVGAVVDVEDSEARDLVKAGYAEETSAKVTAEARQAAEPENKMAAGTDNKDAPEEGARAAGKTTGTAGSGKR